MANVQVHLLDGHQLTVDENDRLADSSIQSLNGVTAGTVTASKFVKADANKDISGLRNVTVTGSFIIGSADMNETDLEKLDGITNGTQAANKAVVADANVNIGVVKATQLHIGASGSETQVTSSAAELNYVDTIAGTPQASKALVTSSAIGVGPFREIGRNLRKQDPAVAKTTAVTLTGAEVLGGLITANPGGAAGVDYTLPLGTAMESAIISVHPGLGNNDSFDFSLVNISTNASEDVTIVTNTGWTLVGEMTVESNDADRARSSGMFRVCRTAANTFTIYRIA